MRNEITPDPSRVGTTRARRIARLVAAPVLAIAGIGVAGMPADASDDSIVPVETRDIVDALRLQCEGNTGAGTPEVTCRWTKPDGAAGVKVLRVAVGSGQGRQTVFRTTDASVSRFVDSPVRTGVRYLYAVRAFDADGNLVAASRPVVAGVAAEPDAAVEVLRLECSATGTVTARCRWSTPESPARALTLWRSVDGGARERVASFANPFPSSYGDIVPASTSRAVYAVIATDGAGEIVARSRADGIVFPPATVDERRVDGPILESPVDRISDVAPPRPPRPTSTQPRPEPPATVPTESVPTAIVPRETVPAVTVPAATVPSTDHASTTTSTVPPTRDAGGGDAGDEPASDRSRPGIRSAEQERAG